MRMGALLYLACIVHKQPFYDSLQAHLGTQKTGENDTPHALLHSNGETKAAYPT